VPIEIKLNITGDEFYINALQSIGVDMKDFTEPFNMVYEDFKVLEKQNFDAEGTPEKFKALSPQYQQWKNKHYPGKRIMQLTGRLYNALVGTSSDTIKTITARSATFGSKLPYDHRHQYGTVGMPQRKIIQIKDTGDVAIQERWEGIFRKWIRLVLDRHGFKQAVTE